MSGLKPWKSVEEQLAILKSRGLQVGNESAALNYLKRIGYYRLSGYWYPMRKIDTVASQQKQGPIRTLTLEDFGVCCDWEKWLLREQK